MAIARCKDHPPDNKHTKQTYSAFAYPVGYPKTATVCGRPHCGKPALTWLNEAEQLIMSKVGGFSTTSRALASSESDQEVT
jgi:hypothetical protein